MTVSTVEAHTTRTNRVCIAVRKDGSPCRGFALGDGYCFSHSPALAAQRVEARSKGGRNSAKSIRLRSLVPPRLLPVFGKLETALEEVYTGELESKNASAMAALARAMVSVLTSGELEERLRDIESRMEGQK